MPRNKGPFLLAACLFLLPVFAAPLRGEVPPGDGASFQPSWTWEASAGYDAQEGGQQGFSLFLTGLKSLTPQGSFFEAQVFGRTQQMEKARTASFGFETGGGLGLGNLTPFLLVDLESGDSRYNAIRVKIGADQTLAKDLALHWGLTGEVTSHQGPFGSLVGLPGSSAEVDDLDAIGGASLQWTLAKPLRLNLAFSAESDETVKIQDLAHTVDSEVDSTEWVYLLSLGGEWAFLENLRLGAEGQGGLDASPAGTFYSKRLGETLTASAAQKQTFAGLSVWIAYDF